MAKRARTSSARHYHDFTSLELNTIVLRIATISTSHYDGQATVSVSCAYNLFIGPAMFEIWYAERVADDLVALRAYDRRIILDRIDQQLSHEPTMETRMKKIVVGLRPPWQHEQPIWQLHVGEYRVYYDFDSEKKHVNVRAILHKPPHTTTEELL